MGITITFVLTSIFTVVIFMAVYGKKAAYTEGMVLGVHIPSYAMQEPDVETLLEMHNKKTKRFYIVNLIVSIPISFLNFVSISVFIIIWSLWILELIIGAMFILYGNHKKLYEIKMEHGWHGASGCKIVVVDTNVSALGDKLPFSVWWHLPVIIGGIACFVVPASRKQIVELPEIWIFAIAFLVLFLGFYCLHMVTNKVRNKVYSSNTELNLQVNQLEKRIYSLIWILADYLNLFSVAAFLYVSATSRWLGGWGIFCYVLIQMIAAGIILTGVIYLGYKKKEIMDKDNNLLYVDDDIYWKNGWYANPNDKRLLVQDRFCSGNYTMNMARPAGKVLTIGGLLSVVALLVFISAVFWKIETTPMYMEVQGTAVVISSPVAEEDFDKKDIISVGLLEDLPDDSFIRTNGVGDKKQSIGKFRGKETGACRMYIYKGYSPILKIELPRFTVFINSKEEGTVEKWYKELAK